MLTEHFIASVGTPAKPPGTSVAKDAAIFLHEFQQLSQQRAVYKKSATPPNGLAVSESHIFAAQTDKGVVHVYNREKGNQEAIVPFPEKISSITLACDDSLLILGTTEGRIFLWEICSGRQITTAQTHLQAITGLAVDPTSNFLLSASKDSTIQIWSLPALLSFVNVAEVSPLRTFSSHHSEVTALALGHSASQCNFAVSASKDKTCLVWDYRTNITLRTYLLLDIPRSISLDSADRAIYLGFEDGSLQQLDLYASPAGHLEAVQNGKDATQPVQPSPESKWTLSDRAHGAVLTTAISFDGSIILSGHQSGSILSWDTARGGFLTILPQTPLPGPVNNIVFLPVTGFKHKRFRNFGISEVVKPKFGAFSAGGDGAVPGNYAAYVNLPSDMNIKKTLMKRALSAFSFPTELLDEGLAELASWGRSGAPQANGNSRADGEDFVAFDEGADANGKPSQQEEIAQLKFQLQALQRLQRKSFEKLEKLSSEKHALMRREQRRMAKANGAKQNGTFEESSSSDEDMHPPVRR